MSEFKLSRIRFNWKGDWSGGTDYIVDDMINHEGATYVALRTHTSADFYNDLAGTDVSPASPKWKLQSEGVSWKKDWTTSTKYARGNIVKYGASVYQCTEAHTSSATLSSGTDGLVADITKWTLVAVSSADWKYNWTVNTLYKINDLVRYNGKVYKCTNQHVSAATTVLGLEANQSDWAVISDSDTWKANWSIGTRYVANDIVKYGGIVYKCVTGHTSADNITLGLEEDQAKWEVQIEGIEYVTKTDTNTGLTSGAWQEEYRYKKNDIVKRGGNLMKCLVGHTSTAGDAGFNTDYAASKWTTFLPGSEYENLWSDSTYYQPGDLVLYGGYIYKAVTFNTGLKPSQYTSDWNVTFEGYKFRGDWNNLGSEDSASNIDYKTGDFVRLSGSLYIAIQDSTNLQPGEWPTYWEKVIDGRQFRDSWSDGTEYYLGDIVTWAGTAYRCIKYHTSTASASRPDLDVEQPDNDYWTVMILGNRTNKLAVKGDLKTFEDQDSTAVDTIRLPIGGTGQALRVTNGLPRWDTADFQDNVYYVAENGIDDEAQGGTLNAPFRTVRFAMTYLLRDESNRIGVGATVNVLAGEYAELLPISIPARVALVGSELRSTTIRPALPTDTVLTERTDPNKAQTALVIPDDNNRQNMFYVRNGSGIRQLTLKGLTGALSGDNIYGTKRPTGGAFVSLDPGTGADDTTVWIANQSPRYYTPSTATYNPADGVFVVTVPQRQFTPTDATYDPLTGILVLTMNGHGLGRGELISIADESLTFTCAKDDHLTDHPYPRITDPIAGLRVPILATTTNTVTINVGISSDTSLHKFKSSTPNSVTWKHNIKVGQSVKLAQNSFTFTCTMDGNTAQKTYPRASDPAGQNKNVRVDQVSDTTFTCNVGKSSASDQYAHTFVSASANAVTFIDVQSGKSPYIQGVTTIGDNCVGMKIDGGLHNGGNRSIVANDFTQVLSDGIGYWATNVGRSELVSVFTYYCHIGYLAENGGILRATNGNNSYGKFGSVSEGYDTTETPQTVTINNRDNEALVDRPFTTGSEILALEYSNAGQSYTSVTPSVTQANGTGLDMRWKEFRDGAIDKIIIDSPQDSTNLGGRGFQFLANSAQGGDTDQITLAASTTKTAAQLNGMRIFIKGGNGAGQYGYIWNYNPATKVALVYRESDNQPGWDNVIPGKVPATVLNATTEYEIEPRITCSEPPFSVSNNSIQTGAPDLGYSDSLNMWYYGVTGTGNWYTSTDGSVWTLRNTNSTGGNVPNYNYSKFAKTGKVLIGITSNQGELQSLGQTAGSLTHPVVFSNDGIAFDDVPVLGFLPTGSLGANIPAFELTSVAIGGSDGNTVMFGNYNQGGATNYGSIIRTRLGTDGASTIMLGNDNSAWSFHNAGLTAENTGAKTDDKFIKTVFYGAGTWVGLSPNGHTTRSTDDGLNWTAGVQLNLDGTEKVSEVVWGNNTFVCALENSDRIFYSYNGVDWYDSALLGDSTRNDWKVAYSQGQFVAVNTNGNTVVSDNALSWRTKATTGNLTAIAGGQRNNLPTFVGVRQSTGVGNIITGGANPIIRVRIDGNKISKFNIIDPGSGYVTPPTITVYDPEETGEPYYTVNIENGVLPQPHFYNRGTGYQSAIITLTGDGFAEELQIGNTMKVTGLSIVPGPGANFRISGQDDTIYRLVKVTEQSGVAPNIQIKFQISPVITRSTAPAHGTPATIRERYSSCRLTGHDFLDIGTGNFEDTNYPALYVEGQTSANATVQANEVVESNGGRVFYTSTDQDGNYRVGELFRVSQSQGGVTLSADFFDLEGLDEIRLGGISVGGTQAVIREFSTETTFVANSNNIVPTQKALKSYIENRFTGGGSNLFTNELTAGQIKLGARTISNTAGANNPSAMATVSPSFTVNGPLGGGLAALNMFFSARTERDDFNG